MEYLLYAGLGALGGFIRLLISGKGIIVLPRIQEVKGSRHLNLGFLVPIFIGAFAGWLATASLGVNGVVSAVAGYSGSDMVENLIERLKRLPGK